jgi:selenocysteine lyase/cysteine desulfurase
MNDKQITDYLYYSTYGHPLVKTPFGDRYIINADTTSSGYPSKVIEKMIETQVLPHYNNTHSNAYSGKLMANFIEQSKSVIREAVNAHDCDRIIFTGNGCSGAINHLIHCLNLRNADPSDTLVLITRAEHHSNHLPWTHLPVNLIYVPVLDNGNIDLKTLKQILNKHKTYKRIIASFIATSNATGVNQNTYKISQLVHEHNGLIFWDFAASAPYIPINMHYKDNDKIYYDAMFISPHKFFGGPQSPGLLIANSKLFENNVPFCPGGGTVRFVCPTFQKYSQNIEVKESGGTPDIIGCIRVGLVFQLKTKFQSYITYKDDALVRYVQKSLQHLETYGLKLLNPLSNLNRIPIFIFNIDNLHYNLVVVLLSDLFGIQTRGGISCCSLLAQDMLKIGEKEQKSIYDQIVSNHGVPSKYGWCRVSFHYAMPNHIIDYILYAIEYVVKNGYKMAKQYIYDENKNNWYHNSYKSTYMECEKLLIPPVFQQINNMECGIPKYFTKEDMNSLMP